ncbi:lysylphosphatidylglycerol synthase transmembrane domain-containing protein [uncultured Litoreibacter sp.]|uniref:lysylphosphatidylglycerol synthase transmembrane domain-containing protein n=1 Tax=uncultured Litoreibacter sp. TaxID=1392394 RepID=UPI002633E698|nr:lysylphosphatidylglycerol synthase transmembrane domain-containing protein [uncultured Litoreibacter sp.]
MTFSRNRILLGVVVAVILVAILAKFADLRWADFARVSPHYVALSVLFSMLTLALRALNYRVIAALPEPRPLGAWIDLSLRHQFLFTAVPSGLGDIGFPVLAKRFVGTDIAKGAGIIGMARLRDLLVLPGLGCLGLAVGGHMTPLIGVLGAALIGGGLMAEQLVAPLRALLRRFGLSGPNLSGPTAFQAQLHRTTLTLASWGAAGAALWCAYAAAGATFPVGDVFIMLAGLNLIGVLAISVGGLGVAEAGSTGVLAFLGYTLEKAAQLSLVARPILLVSVLLSCVLWWGIRKLAR